MKKSLIIFLMLVLAPVWVYSLGQTEEDDYREVSGKDNWEYEVPLEGKEPGEYNLLIRAKDKALNETYAGPFDVIVDPESDLPLVSITNPLSFMRVGGTLNIVGTARDDDKIQKVLLKINDGEFFEAVGQEFWSYTLDAKVLEDGQHTITAKAIDINGLEGHETSVIYNQDTLKPTNTIENYKNGVIFSGKVTINGKVEDANGIADIQISKDNQETYNSIKFKEDKEEAFYTFVVDIDTRDLNDGPNIYWVKSKDKTGSVAYTAFLFFVDNMGPGIHIIDPVETDRLNGQVTISGKIDDKIGIRSFKYLYGDTEGEIQLNAGNPYWSVKLDFLNEKKNNPKVKFISEDTSGNIAVLEKEIILDKEGDIPTLVLTSPQTGKVYKKDLLIEGYILDDDYIGGITYSIDGGDDESIKTFNAFTKSVENLSSGTHKLLIKAGDNFGTIGYKTEVEFEIDSFPPNISFDSVLKNGEEVDYYPGIEVITDGGNKITGSVFYGNPISSLKYKIENGEIIDIPFKKVDESRVSFDINIDSKFHYGNLNYTVIAMDNYGNEVSSTSNIYVYNYAKVNDDWGLYTPDMPKDIYITSGESFDLIYNGPKIKSVITKPQSDIVKIDYSNNAISLIPKGEGRVDNLQVVVRTDKGDFSSSLYNLTIDNTKPVITLSIPRSNSVQSSVMSVSGSVDDQFLKSVEYRFSNEPEFKEIKYTGNKKYSFNTNLDLPTVTSESLSIEVKATDLSGNSSVLTRSFTIKENAWVSTLTTDEMLTNSGKSSDKPEIDVNFPIANEVFFSEPYLSGFSRDDDGVKTIVVIDETGKRIEVPSQGYFDIDLTSLGAGYKTLTVSSLDINGTESKLKKVSYTYEPGNSSVKLISFEDWGKNTPFTIGAFIDKDSEARLKGVVSGDIPGDLTYSYNGGEFKKAVVSGGDFTLPVPSLDWGRNNLTINFTDKYNRVSSYYTSFYIIDKVNIKNINDKPGIYFTSSNLYGEYINLTGTKSFSGIFNGRKIDKVELEAETGAVPDFLAISHINEKVIITSPKTGISSNVRVKVTTIDNDEYTSNYFKFICDNNAPELIVETADNQFIKTSITINGQVKDDLKIESLSYSINSGETWENMELKTPSALIETESYTATSTVDLIKRAQKDIKEFIFNKDIDFANRKDGGYSIWVKATDTIGNETVKKIALMKDNTNPEITLFIPGTDEVNGVMSLIGKSSDNIELDNISYSKDGISFTEVGKKDVFKFDVDFGMDEVFPESFVLRATDRAGNFTDLYPIFNINQERDKPVVQIQTPVNQEIIRNDFVISGMAFDDDAVDKIFYSLDGSDFTVVAQNDNNFSVNIPLESIENNEHIITVKAVDILGVDSDVITSSFWVSKEEPVSNLVLPKIETTKKDTIKLVGTSFDKNGIDSVYVSTDNGVSYQKAVGAEDWTYSFNTKNIKDGTYSIFVKAIDKLKTEGFYSTLINIDNTPPELIINQPVDGDILSDKIVFSGRSMDNIGLRDVRYKIYSHTDKTGDSVVVNQGTLSSKGIFNIDIPLEGFELGEYNIELIAHDEAENRSISTRNFTVTESDNAGDLEMLFPQPGSVLTSQFEVAGKVLGFKPVDFVECYIDDVLFSEIKVNEFNYFNLKVDTMALSEGTHYIMLKATLDDGQIFDTPSYDFIVKNSGAWLNIVNMSTGDNISGRPFLTGEAGYIQPEDTLKQNRISPVAVEVSLDNGQIFTPAAGNSQWEFRVETWQYDDGLTPILVRATYSNGETKTSRISVNFDRTTPDVAVLEKLEKGRFNEGIKLSGIASDSNGLTDISVILREGSKSHYEIPGLFQGMFVDMETGYGKLYGTGVGLTFFDDNVKLQFTYGQTRTATVDARIKGNYYGGKLLANIYTLEYGNIFGPDLENISSSLGFGASFTKKTLTVSEEDFIMWYSAIVSQLEFIKFKMDTGVISSVSLYVDFETTLISSETDGGFFPKVGLGTRITLF